MERHWTGHVELAGNLVADRDKGARDHGNMERIELQIEIDAEVQPRKIVRRGIEAPVDFYILAEPLDYRRHKEDFRMLAEVEAFDNISNVADAQLSRFLALSRDISAD